MKKKLNKNQSKPSLVIYNIIILKQISNDNILLINEYSYKINADIVAKKIPA